MVVSSCNEKKGAGRAGVAAKQIDTGDTQRRYGWIQKTLQSCCLCTALNPPRRWRRIPTMLPNCHALPVRWRYPPVVPAGPSARPRRIKHNPGMQPDTRDLELTTLLDRVARQDASALKVLYDRSASVLFGLAMRVVRNPEWAEDVVQESYLTIWRSAGDYRASLSPPMAWMGLIVRSRALDLLRRRAAERADRTDELDETLADTLEGDAPNPMDEVQASQQARALHRCLQQLEQAQRQVLSLAYLRDLSHHELAEQLRLPLGTVKTWIRRGLIQLRGCMAGTI
jgi:RNA polymerase sigma-70 factor (ECF subfamily)